MIISPLETWYKYLKTAEVNSAMLFTNFTFITRVSFSIIIFLFEHSNQQYMSFTIDWNVVALPVANVSEEHSNEKEH